MKNVLLGIGYVILALVVLFVISVVIAIAGFIATTFGFLFVAAFIIGIVALLIKELVESWFDNRKNKPP